MKILEHILNTIIRKQVPIHNMSFGLMPGSGTIDAIFILRQLQKKYLHKKKKTFFAFVDLKKASDCPPCTALWWQMQKFGIYEWTIQIFVPTTFLLVCFLA